MNFINSIYLKLYYRFWNIALPYKYVELANSLKEKKNIFLYFDYEREYSGHNTSINNNDISKILQFLGEYDLKTTWFTVGKIFEKYPDSIEVIIKHGHEIGSHTYSHISPLRSGIKRLRSDFLEFNKCSENVTRVKGFHSPKGQWSIKMLKYLKQYKYIYDIVGRIKTKYSKPQRLWLGGKKYMYRLLTVGDDWPLYNNDYTEKNVLEFFIKQYKKINTGDIAGIGFHPWVLYSNMNILTGFKNFIKFLKQQSNLRIETAGHYIEQIIESKTQ